MNWGVEIQLEIKDPGRTLGSKNKSDNSPININANQIATLEQIVMHELYRSHAHLDFK